MITAAVWCYTVGFALSGSGGWYAIAGGVLLTIVVNS